MMLRLLPLLVLLTGCGGASFDNGVYQDDHARYRVGILSPAWRRVEVEGNDLAFYRPQMGSITVNATCSEYEDVPISALVNQLLFDTTERRFLVEEVVTLDGRGARHVLMQLELDGVPLEMELYVVRKDGCVFDLVHTRSRAAAPEARSTFATFVQHFAVLKVHLDD